MAANTSKGISLLDAERPLTLSGPPRGIRGEFRLENSSDDKVVIRAPQVRPPKKSRSSSAKPLADPQLVMRRIIVRARQSRPVPISLSLDPSTPPGTYHAELDIEGQVRSVVIRVTEGLSATILPDEIVLPGKAGKVFERQIIVRNDGNVPVTVPKIGTIVLDEDLVHCRALRGALADAGATMTSLDDFAVALGKRYQALYETLLLKVRNDRVEVAPGAEETVDLSITLPDGIDRRARYSGYAPISVLNLSIIIVPE